jgi:hypothetical protein
MCVKQMPQMERFIKDLQEKADFVETQIKENETKKFDKERELSPYRFKSKMLMQEQIEIEEQIKKTRVLDVKDKPELDKASSRLAALTKVASNIAQYESELDALIDAQKIKATELRK